MKKVLAILLAAVMLLTSFVVIVNAEDEKHETYVFRPNDGAEMLYVENEEQDITASWNNWCRFSDGNKQIIYCYPALNLASATKVTWTANIGQHIKLQVSQDKSNWKDVYVCETHKWADDKYGDKYDDYTYDLTSFLDKNGPKKIYVRILDSFPEDGWGGAVTIDGDVILDIAYTGESVNPKGTIPVTNAIKAYELSGSVGVGGFMYTYKADTPVDISGMKFIAFDLFVGYRKNESNAYVDLDTMKNIGEFMFELTSSGEADHQESAVGFKLTDYAPKLNVGWNTIQIPILDLVNKTDGELNKTAWNFLRLFNNEAFTPADVIEVEDEDTGDTETFAFDVKIGNVRFQDETFTVEDTSVEGEHETYTFIIEKKPQDDKTPGESEAPFFVESTAGWNSNQRFSDGNGHTIYKYDIINYRAVKQVTWEAMTSAQLLLRVSNDGENWTEFYRYEDEDVASGTVPNKGLPAKHRVYDITEYMDFSKGHSIWISIEDSYTNGGWGGSIHVEDPCILDVIYEVLSDGQLDELEMTPTEHSLPIWGCNKVWGAFKVDKENRQEGSACTTTTVGTGQAPQVVLPQAYDATGKDTLEFELYVSDLAFFDFGDKSQEKHFSNSWLELTSSGQYDKEEIAWDPVTIRQYIVGEPQVGWNHVALPFSVATPSGGDFRINNVNYIRFFFVGAPDEAKDIVVKVDNFRLTDKAAVEHAAFVEEASEFVSKVNELTFLTVESIKSQDDLTSAKKAYNALERIYKRLSDGAKATIAKEVMDKFNAANAAIENYSAPVDNIGNEESETKAEDETPGSDDKQETKAEDLKPDDEKKKNGCKSTLVGGFVVLAIVSAAGFGMIKRKKED